MPMQGANQGQPSTNSLQANFVETQAEDGSSSDNDEITVLSIEKEEDNLPTEVISLNEDTSSPNPQPSPDSEVAKIIEIQDLNERPKSIEVLVRSFNSILSFTVDTGSPASFINKATAETLMKDKDSNAVFKNIKEVNLGMRFIDYNKNNINILGALYVDISSAGYKVKRARFLVVDKKRCLLGLDLHAKIGIVTKQIPYQARKPKATQINSVEDNTEAWISNEWKIYFTTKFKDVFTRLGRSKNHVVSTLFHSPLIPIQEKGRRIPIHILDRVEKEINKLIEQDHIYKLDNCTNDCFIPPIVITAKKDGSVKLALDAKPVIAQIYKK